MSDQIIERLDRIVAIEGELETILQTLILNDSTIIDALAQMLGAIQEMQSRSEQTQNRLTQEIETLNRQLAIGERKANGKPIVVGDQNFAAQNPEVALLQYLYSFLDSNCAIDIGANTGEVAGHLLEAGYTVYAFEPEPSTFAKLSQKAASNPRLHPFNFAIGSSESTMALHIAANAGSGEHDVSQFSSLVEHPMLEDCAFSKEIPVTVRTLASLIRDGELPEKVGLLKIDTEGFDLEVIRGMGERLHPPIVASEFWDRQHAFGRAGHGDLVALVKEMRGRQYPWHIVIYHLDRESRISFYCNRTETIAGSWGNVIFFRERALFAEAWQWCEEVLPPTVYR
jgi:FkbM family methyltransferase